MGAGQMRFGFVLPNNWGIDDVTAVCDLAVEAEDLGLDSVWVNHHVVNIGYIADRLDDRPYHDALTVLTWAAARTSEVRLGTSVLVMPYLHPMVLAKALATLDQLSDGRVIAGLGVGSLPEENAVLRVIFDERGRFGNEFIEILRSLWSPGPANHRGEFWSMSDVVASPKPAQDRLPIWIGGSGGPAQRRAVAHGEGWHPMCSVEGLARRMEQFVPMLERAGRARTDIVVAPRIDVSEVGDAAAVAAWADAGADELIVSASGGSIETHREALRHVAQLAAQTAP
ncbi:MAG: TIGR03619 family F420-dependent LLM class oxidoreductase [Actinomycetota bacterium]